MMKLLFLALLLSACTFKKGPLGNQTPQGHEELYSEPSKPELILPAKTVKRIVIAATNDVEASYRPSTLSFSDKHSKEEQQILVGGAEVLSRYVQILRETYQDVVLVDSGDLFSSQSSSERTQKFYTDLKYDALTLGLGDFNLRLPEGTSSTTEFFKQFARNSSTPLVLSNLIELKTARQVEWKGAVPYVMKDLRDVKVGIIGLLPDDIATLTPVDNRVGLFVEGMLQSTLRQARLLRSLGADIIVVLTHQGIPCGHNQAQETKLPLGKVNFEPTKQGACELKGALGAYLERLPPNLVDVVVGGRHHEKMANIINGMVVMSGFEHGKSLNYVELFIDTKEKKLLKEETYIHQPVMICHEFFKETDDCWPYDESIDHRTRTPAKFLGQTIEVAPTQASNTKNKSLAPDYLRAMEELNADIVFFSNSTGGSQLVKFEVPGKILIDLLEREYNRGAEGKWKPDPFLVNEEVLRLYVKGSEISPEKSYWILSDLESLQAYSSLKEWIQHASIKSLREHSWASFQISDSVKTKVAAPSR